MPLIKKSATSALDWNSFPAPSPEAEKWRPDPNSIARPGGLKDPRFNKDPYAEEKKAAMKREMRLHGYHSPLGPTVISINGATASRPAVGSWPVQAACSSGMPTPPLTSPPVSINENSIKPVAEVSTPTIAFTTPKSPPAYDPMRKVTQATMEDLPIMTMGSAKVSKFVRAASPEKSSLPAWAGPLEKALAEDTLKTPLVPGSAASTTISIPTHMRRQLSDGDSRPLAAARYQPLSLDAHFEQACDTTRRVSDPISPQPHLNGVSSRGAGSGSAAAQSLFENGVQHPPATTTTTSTITGLGLSLYKDGGSHLKLEMILIMESDLLREKLAKFTADELDDHLSKIYPIHDQWFQATYGGNIAEGSSQQGHPNGVNFVNTV